MNSTTGLTDAGGRLAELNVGLVDDEGDGRTGTAEQRNALRALRRRLA